MACIRCRKCKGAGDRDNGEAVDVLPSLGGDTDGGTAIEISFTSGGDMDDSGGEESPSIVITTAEREEGAGDRDNGSL